MNELKDVINFLAKSGVIGWSDVVEDESLNNSINDTSPKGVEGTSPQYTEEIDDSIVEKLNQLKVWLNTLKYCLDSGAVVMDHYDSYTTIVEFDDSDVVAMKKTTKEAVELLNDVLTRIKVY